MKLQNHLYPALGLAACVGVLALIIGTNAVWLDTSSIIAIYGLLALSVGISYGQAGILSVAQAAFAAIGAYATAILCMRYDVSPFLTVFASVLLPAVIAYPLARLVTRLSPLALAIATLVFGNIVDLSLREGGNLTGGYIGLSGVPPIPFITSPMLFNILAWSIVILVVVAYSNLIHSATGRALNTIRSDALRATADGIDVGHERSMVLALSAAVAGLSGWLYVHNSSYIGPDSLGPPLSLSVLLMAVVGGSRTILGPIMGAAVLTLIFKFIPAQEVQGIFYGGALIAVLLLAPRGLLGIRIGRWMAARKNTENAEKPLPQVVARRPS
ncbi:MAG: amino acid/amide transporter rane protein 2, family [Herminiimonas sp.]|nr:amino acid/amide transporter rane protein 2, family [Herminiimonas sp.]